MVVYFIAVTKNRKVENRGEKTIRKWRMGGGVKGKDSYLDLR